MAGSSIRVIAGALVLAIFTATGLVLVGVAVSQGLTYSCPPGVTGGLACYPGAGALAAGIIVLVIGLGTGSTMLALGHRGDGQAMTRMWRGFRGAEDATIRACTGCGRVFTGAVPKFCPDCGTSLGDPKR